VCLVIALELVRCESPLFLTFAAVLPQADRLNVAQSFYQLHVGRTFTEGGFPVPHPQCRSIHRQELDDCFFKTALSGLKVTQILS
jgi:hypothetical protein